MNIDNFKLAITAYVKGTCYKLVTIKLNKNDKIVLNEKYVIIKFHVTKLKRKYHLMVSIQRKQKRCLFFDLCIYHWPSPGWDPRQIQLCLGLIGGLERLFYPGGVGMRKVWFTTSFHCGKNWGLVKEIKSISS